MLRQNFRIAWALALLFTLSACATSFVAAGQTERSVFERPLQSEQMRGVIVKVLNQRRHAIEAEEPGRITTTMAGGGRSLQLDIRYDDLGFTLTPVATSGFETQARGQAEPALVDRRYVVWMRRLRTLIDREVAALREELQEQQEHAQQQELRVAAAHQQAEQAALERERLSRMPVVAPGGPTYAPAPLSGGFNVTRPPNGLGPVTVHVINQGADPIHQLVLRQTGEPTWRPNQLSYTIEPGATYHVTGVPAGRWEMRIETLSMYKEWGDLYFGAGGEYTLVVTSEGWFRL